MLARESLAARDTARPPMDSPAMNPLMLTPPGAQHGGQSKKQDQGMEEGRKQSADGRIQLFAGFAEKVVEQDAGGGTEIVQDPVKGNHQQGRNRIGYKGRLGQSLPGRIGKGRIAPEDGNGHAPGPVHRGRNVFICRKGQFVQDEPDHPDADDPEADVKQDGNGQDHQGRYPGHEIIVQGHEKAPFAAVLSSLYHWAGGRCKNML